MSDAMKCFLDVTAEHEHAEDPEIVILTQETRIHFFYYPGYPATGPSYSSGGEPGEGPGVELNYAEVLGNGGQWIKLRRGDPLDAWCERYFVANEHEFLAAAHDDIERSEWDRADYEYECDRDDRMMERRA